MSRKHKKVFTTLNFIEQFPNLAFTATGCISISAFVSLLGISTKITSSKIGLRICAIAAGVEKYNSITNKKKNKHDKIVLIAKPKWNSIDILISTALIDWNISHDEFFLIIMC